MTQKGRVNKKQHTMFYNAYKSQGKVSILYADKNENRQIPL